MDRFDTLFARYHDLKNENGKFSWLGAFWWIGIAFVIGLICYLKESESATGTKAWLATIALIGAIIFVAVSFGIIIRRSQKISEEIEDCKISLKKLYVSDAADKYFSDYRYYPDRGFAEDDVDTFAIDLAFTLSDDYLEGTLPNGIRVRRADVHRGERHATWIIYDSPKTLEETLVIRPRSAFDFQLYPEIETEDSEFNRLFRCFCNDKAEAFYMLTPRMMRALIEVHKNLKRLESASVEITFVKHKFLVVLRRTTDPFEIDFNELTSRDAETAYATIEFYYLKLIGEALGVQDDVKEPELSREAQRKKQQEMRAQKEPWWNSPEYAESSENAPAEQK